MKQGSKHRTDLSADAYERRADHWFARCMARQLAAAMYRDSHDMDSQDEFNQWLHILCEASQCFATSERQRHFAVRARERHGHSYPSLVGDESRMESVIDALLPDDMEVPRTASMQAIPLERVLMELDAIERIYKEFFEYESRHGMPGAMYALGMSDALYHIRGTIIQRAEALASKEGEER